MKRQILIAALLITISGTICAQVASHAPTMIAPRPAAAQMNNPVARVNGVVLTQSDLVREMYTIFPYASQHNGTFPKGMEPEIRKGAMQMIVFEELVYQEALRRNMSIPASTIAAAETKFRKRFSSDAEFQNVLRQEFQGSQKVLRAKIRRSMLIDALLKSEIDRKSQVSLAEARAFYDKNPDKFRFPESYEFQSISIIPPENPNPQQQKEAAKNAEEALKQAKATNSYRDFGLLAEKISEDDYRVNMGDHKAVPATELPPEVVKVLATLHDGQVSDLVKLGSAYTIVRVTKHDLAGKKRFEEIKAPLMNDLRTQKAEHLRAALNSRLRKSAKVEEL